ncbi:MAG: hypothetical protein MZV63_38030 [Marinilabiliales bacterium]|nr:hypothetical protein [Marinilabiliales bacterium]
MTGSFSILKRKNSRYNTGFCSAGTGEKQSCPECKGSRLRKEAGYVKVAGKTIQELVSLPVGKTI